MIEVTRVMEPEINIRMTWAEAKLLFRIACYDSTVPQAIEKVGSSSLGMTEILQHLKIALSRAGIDGAK